MLTIAEKRLRNRRQRFLIFLLGLVCVPTISGASERLDYEIKPFSLIGTTTALKIGFLSDRRRQSNFATSNSESTVWQEELLVGTRSYVYHPGFLNIKLDLLPRLVQQKVSTCDESDSLSESLLGFNTQFNFLSLKTYPFSLFARRTYPSSFVGPVASYRIENDEHGITGIVAGPGQTSLRYGITRQSIDGEGFDSIIDDSRDRGTLRLEIPYSELGFVGVTYEAIYQDSSSGSPGLPIQRSLLNQDNFTIDARHNYGEQGQNYLNQGLALLKYSLEAGQLTKVDDLRYNITNRHEISESMATNVGYTYSSSERLDADSKVQSAVTGFTHLLQSGLRYSATAALEDSRATGQDRRVARVGGDFRHSLTTTGWGTIGGPRRLN